MKTNWKLVEALALTTDNGNAAGAHVTCFTEEDYILTCRKLIPDAEINRDRQIDGVLITRITTADKNDIAICFVADQSMITIEMPVIAAMMELKPPSILQH